MRLLNWSGWPWLLELSTAGWDRRTSLDCNVVLLAVKSHLKNHHMHWPLVIALLNLILIQIPNVKSILIWHTSWKVSRIHLKEPIKTFGKSFNDFESIWWNFTLKWTNQIVVFTTTWLISSLAVRSSEMSFLATAPCFPLVPWPTFDVRHHFVASHYSLQYLKESRRRKQKLQQWSLSSVI